MAELTREYVKRRHKKTSTEKVPTPEMGAGRETYVRVLPTPLFFKHRALFAAMDTTDETDAETKALHVGQMCSLGICSETGKPLYTIEQADELIETWPLPVLTRCLDALNKINGFDTDGKTKAKNSRASRRASSRSSSRKRSRKR